MKKINVSFSKSLQHKLKSLLKHYQSKQYVYAEKLSVSITQEFPEHQLAWKVLAAVLTQTGRLSESLIPCQKSAQLEPTDSNAHYNLGIILNELGRLDAATFPEAKILHVKRNPAVVC
jgi:Flp pilus assembly protein TadD|tara:strand:- start:405 stop:758 length:354 start_codon:yes stop_codon:yes gene_type:complete